MRRSTIPAFEKVNTRWPLPRRMALIGVLVAGVGWSVYSFGQEAFLGYRLSHQASQLRSENATLQEQNAGYRRDIAALSSGAGAEEQARINGYARKGEQLYLVGQPPAAAPAPARGPAVSARGHRAARARQGVAQGAFDPVGGLRRWVADHWHG